MGNTSSKGPFFIAMLVCRSVCFFSPFSCFTHSVVKLVGLGFGFYVRVCCLVTRFGRTWPCRPSNCQWLAPGSCWIRRCGLNTRPGLVCWATKRSWLQLPIHIRSLGLAYLTAFGWFLWYIILVGKCTVRPMDPTVWGTNVGEGTYLGETNLLLMATYQPLDPMVLLPFESLWIL